MNFQEYLICFDLVNRKLMLHFFTVLHEVDVETEEELECIKDAGAEVIVVKEKYLVFKLPDYYKTHAALSDNNFNFSDYFKFQTLRLLQNSCRPV